MAEIMAAGAMAALTEPYAGEETLAGQVLGILLEVLEGPGLDQESKDRLRRLIDTHEGHPERALLEHLRCVRHHGAAIAEAG